MDRKIMPLVCFFVVARAKDVVIPTYGKSYQYGAAASFTLATAVAHTHTHIFQSKSFFFLLTS